jgi:phosphatidylserine/phosphatidylglycerophosphate/cardiolipin synthase-like enzyme
MSGIAPIFAAAAADRVGETLVTLPDPDRLLADPIFRPGVARHPSARIILLEIRAKSGGTASVRAPAASSARLVTGIPPIGTSGLTTLIELSPLPFGDDARTLFAALGAVPTFYVGVPSPSVADDDFVELGEELGSINGAATAFIGAVFPDGVTRVPSGWIQEIADALSAVDPSNPWSSMLDLFPADERRLIVVDHAGRPPEEALEFQIRMTGDTAARWTRTLPAGVFDLEAAVAADPLDGVITSLFTRPPGQELHVRAVLGDDAIPVQSIVDRAIAGEPSVTSVGDEFVRIPPAAGAVRRHLQITDLGAWFPPASTPSSISRFHRHSRLEPLIDGIPTFKALLNDLKRAEHQGHGAQFTGWAFNRFELDEPDDDRDLVEIADDILKAGGDVRVLATKFVQDEQNFNAINDPVLLAAAMTLYIGAFGTEILLDALKKTGGDKGVFTLAGLFQGFTIAMLAPLSANILEALEPASPLLEPLNDLSTAGRIAIHARNPVRLRDNPVIDADLPLNLDQVTDHFGIWHNKMQLVKFRVPALDPAGDRTEFSAFVGGIDINENRLDTPSHNAASPYHDVHCRLTGPIVHDAWTSFNERWEFDRGRAGGALDPIPVPAVETLPQQAAKHLVRMGRTYFGPRPDGQSEPLPFSPEGERSIYDTLLAAIRNAQRSIFIAEQYFASEGSVNPPPGESSYHRALLDAASPGRRLVIVLPFEGDQPFAERRRRRLISELREAWKSKLFVGFPQRRPSLGQGHTVAAVGRTLLLHDIGPEDTKFRIGPDVRVPKQPFWMWIDGELMLIRSTTRLQGGHPKDFVTEVDVLRSFVPNDPTRRFSTPRSHWKGAPVTHSRLGSIYVHSKIMVVDDLFVSIGSANLNRRGFFWDGEINAFAVPEQLAAAPDNPARMLRTGCWAQYLGVPQSMGAALFVDPVGDTDFFLRSPFLGNRFTPLEAIDLKGQISLSNSELANGSDMMLQFLKFAGLATVEAEAEALFNRVSDPTSHVNLTPIFETF